MCENILKVNDYIKKNFIGKSTEEIYGMYVRYNFSCEYKITSLTKTSVVVNFINNNNIKNIMQWLKVSSYLKIIEHDYKRKNWLEPIIIKKHISNLNFLEREKFKCEFSHLNLCGHLEPVCIFLLFAKKNMTKPINYMIKSNLIWITSKNFEYYKQSLNFLNDQSKNFIQKKLIGYRLMRVIGTHNK